jgi:transcriptional regulator with XRE-family HTH domain
MATVGDRLRESREGQGMPIRTLAEACGISEGMVRKIEGDDVKNPSLIVGLRIAKALDVDPYWLATGQEDSLNGRVARLERLVEYVLKHVRATAPEP